MLLKHSKYSSLLTLGFLTVSLITTSFGGSLATTALAATPEVNIQEEKSGIDQGIIAGVAALGLISLLSNHNNSHVSEPVKTTPTSTTSPTTTSTAGTSTAPAAGTAADEQKAFNLLNADRAAYGLKPLRFNSQLTALGERYAQDMINRNYFSHTNPEGQSPFDRIKEAGISYSYAGENIAINSNVTTAQQAFMNSSGHKANILNTNYTDVGIGVRYDSKGAAHVVQEFIGK